MTLKNVFLAVIFLVLGGCSQAGWVGYYKMNLPAIYKYTIDENTGNGASVNLNKQELYLSLPRDCSTFRFAGIGTPITPPIPLFYFRSWSTAGKNGDGLCHDFSANIDHGVKLKLQYKDQIYEPIKGFNFNQDRDKYIFPIRAKNLDSGIIILEKDGQKVEVPFEYKYFKFWY